MAAPIKQHHDRVADVTLAEIANELNETRLPAAGLELDAVVKATEAASNTIMECAEAVLSADAGDAQSFKAMVEDKMLIIFEACSFQDITGQRIAKVVETLKHIEARVARFAEAVRTKDSGRFDSEAERAADARAQRLLLHGPQLAGDGIGQREIDALMAEKQGGVR
jgi:chemotaxis protein CheZ